MYQFTPSQANVVGAPVGATMFGEIDQVFSRDNASTKAHFGTSTRDAISYDAANRQFFNDTLELGVDCGRLNSAAGRPDLGSAAGGSACYPASMSAQRAAKQMDANYNAYGPTAEQIVLAEGDVRYAPSRFADQNNYNGPSISDDSFQPRLMGSRDVAPSGCATSLIEQTYGNTSSCSLADDPLPYPDATDPRKGYGVDSPHTDYWSPLELAGAAPEGCELTSGDAGSLSLCNIASVTTATSSPIPPNYSGEQASRAGAVRAARARAGAVRAHAPRAPAGAVRGRVVRAPANAVRAARERARGVARSQK
jgi:hypothetical protein